MQTTITERLLAFSPQFPGASRLVLRVTAKPGNAQAELTHWEKAADQWQQVFAPIPVSIGRNGFIPAQQKKEGDGCTPLGIYFLGTVFGSGPAAMTAMPYRQVTAADYWIDDPASPRYNQWVTGALPGESHERMLRDDGVYRYGIVVEYNTNPVVAGKGSAIFMHLWRTPGEPTAGCVAMAEADLLRILAWLEPWKQPVIILG